ncbi:hypothetical protein BTO05_04860 [Winogradskyella sp. PC-19]|uniref:DinB family protein n=1 Tax=unclassified Winogradskyella TaxID=2615021 RepID=UPI000B3C308F|nr:MULTISPECIES: DinB family protein [unclassified Winogradskyella]ARV08995.1 hypothetical protein BTO05_04860 [Winogradskyella sp. PC-19]
MINKNIELLSKHFKSIFFGGNWTAVNVKDTLDSIVLEEANYKVNNCNTIAHLIFHINYYIEGVLPVFDGGNLDIKDKFSYDAPIFKNESEWKDFKVKVLKNAEDLNHKISQLNEDQLFQPFVAEKYGTYYSNIHGIIEHTHYHLGQIVILKKLIENKL